MGGEKGFSAKFKLGYGAVWIICLGVFFSDQEWPRSWAEVVDVVPRPSLSSFSGLCLYVLVLAVLSEVVPGRKVDGTLLANGSRLVYKTNGLQVTLLLTAACGVGAYQKWIDGAFIADHFFELWVTTNVFSLILATYLTVVGRGTRGRGVLVGRPMWEDFLLGAELNPHILGVDVKFFSYRPGMGGWLLVNLSFLCKQYTTLGFVTNQMVLYQLMTNYYIFDYFYFEEKMTTTWDIIAERFGLMLVWADYFFIPLTFSIQNLYLYQTSEQMATPFLAMNLLLFVLGTVLFRSANSQKHTFKVDPTQPIWGSVPKTVNGKLLASGFWGLARHVNYLGDLLIALSFCLPCGRTSPKGYFYFFYLLLLLLHREKRDEQRCAAKYGSTWEEYCRLVPSRILPFVY